MPYSEELYEINKNLSDLASAICNIDPLGTTDKSGTHVTSLSGAVIGSTAGLVFISDSIDEVAEALRDVAAALGDIATAITEK